jgi:pimeloyl-ACP methyl ester carboxylesterase
VSAARLVLLHSPLLGPLTWRAVAAALRDAGAAAETPAWTPLSEIDGDFYATLAGDMAAQVAAGDGPPLLVAHSAAGALAPAVASRLPGVAGVIFVDALLPHPGLSWLDTAPQGLRETLRSGVTAGLLPAWSDWWPPGALERLVPDEAVRAELIAELEPIPAAFFEEAAPATALSSPAAYLKLSEAYEDEARLANRQGWPLVRLPLHHLAPLTDPAAVARSLESLAARLVGQ